MFELDPLIKSRIRQMPEPGILGRLRRFLVGLFALSFVAEVLAHNLFLVKTPPDSSSFN